LGGAPAVVDLAHLRVVVRDGVGARLPHDVALPAAGDAAGEHAFDLVAEHVAPERRLPGLAGGGSERELLGIERAPESAGGEGDAKEAAVAVEVVACGVAQAGAAPDAIAGHVVPACDRDAVAALFDHAAERIALEHDLAGVVFRAEEAA